MGVFESSGNFRKDEALPVISILCSCCKLGICCLQNFGADLRYILSVIGTFIISRVWVWCQQNFGTEWGCMCQLHFGCHRPVLNEQRFWVQQNFGKEQGIWGQLSYILGVIGTISIWSTIFMGSEGVFETSNDFGLNRSVWGSAAFCFKIGSYLGQIVVFWSMSYSECHF